MKIQELMTTNVRTCRAGDTLGDAARTMWEGDLGCLPIVDDANSVVGMITDRDLCMSALMSGAPLWALNVGDAMAKVVFTVKATDKPRAAAKLMVEHQLRRLPVVDAKGTLVGMVTLGALAGNKSPLSSKDVVGVLAAVTSARPAPVSARMEIEVTRESLPTQVLQPAPRKAKKAAAPVAKREFKVKAKAKAAK